MNAKRGPDEWRDSYSIQSERRRGQIDLVMRYTATNQCRMSALVRHFGDHADGQEGLWHLRFLRTRRLRGPNNSAIRRKRSRTRHERPLRLCGTDRRARHREAVWTTLPRREDEPRHL